MRTNETGNGNTYLAMTKREARELVEAILNALCSQTDYQQGEAGAFIVELED